MALSGAWCPEQSQICNVQMLQCPWEHVTVWKMWCCCAEQLPLGLLSGKAGAKLCVLHP